MGYSFIVIMKIRFYYTTVLRVPLTMARLTVTEVTVCIVYEGSFISLGEWMTSVNCNYFRRREIRCKVGETRFFLIADSCHWLIVSEFRSIELKNFRYFRPDLRDRK